MTAVFIPRELEQWREVQILKACDFGAPPHPYEHRFWLPEPLACWDVFDYWEADRFRNMRDNLTHTDILYDVGAEQGWCSLLYASYVGPTNVVLIEPSPLLWPNIAATWTKNYRHRTPRACYDGLLSNTTDDTRTDFTHWPDSAAGELVDCNTYAYLHDNPHRIPQMRLDDLVARTGAVPTALTIDVEGAELQVLHGAATTLRRHHPRVWLSIHPDLMGRDYGDTPNELHAFMADIGYRSEHLTTDHEQHWVFAT